MGKIKVLDKLTANMIAAGEVVERPASVVKELFENALDAGAKRITVEIRDGGKELVRITDNGSGMDREDAEMCVLRHATSKISNPNDLFDIKTMGFRGEAMASIASVSKVTITTRREDTDVGTRLVVKGGEIAENEEIGCPVGTTVTVEELFFNTPARMKFLKKASTESAHIEEMIGKLILANPSVSVRFVKDGKEIFYSKGDGLLDGAIYCVYGSMVASNLVKVSGERDGVKISGYVGNPNITKPSLKFETFCVNGRICRTKTMVSALDFAFFQKMAQGKHPFCVLNIGIDYEKCDVNIHPQKAEVKFSDENLVYEAIMTTVRNALDNTLFIKNADNFSKSGERVTKIPDYPPYVHNVKQYGRSEAPKFASLPFQNAPDFNILNEEGKKEEKDIPFKEEVVTFEFSKQEDAKPEEKEETKITENERENEKKDSTVPYGEEAAAFEFPEEENKEASPWQTEEVIPEIEEKSFTQEENYRIIGQIFSTYIIIEKGNEMLLMDQHAAHERMNYEMLREHYKNKSFSSQILMMPIKVELSPTEHITAVENAEVFGNLGMEIEDFGGNTIIVRSIPSDVKKTAVERLVFEIIDEISKKGDMPKEDFNQRLLYLTACKMSIKANMALTTEAMEALVKRAFALNGKTTCPHGRPLFVSYEKISIENKFER